MNNSPHLTEEDLAQGVVGADAAARIEETRQLSSLAKTQKLDSSEKRYIPIEEARQEMTNGVALPPSVIVATSIPSPNGLSEGCMKYLRDKLPAALDSLSPQQQSAAIGELRSGKGGYQIEEFMARGAESVLFNGRTGSGHLFCVKAIRNSLNRWIGSGITKNAQSKLQAVSYRTKYRHLTNEWKIGQMLGQRSEDSAAVAIYSLRKIRRFGLELGWDLLMEKINGVDLTDRALLRSMTLADKVKVCIQICNAVGELHQRHLIHLDIKPSNFMLDGTGRVRVIDFGISVPSGFCSPSIAGTAGYFSPEQICQKPLKEDTDIFALGITFALIFGGKNLSQDAEETINRNGRKEAAVNLERNDMPAISDIPELISGGARGIADVIRSCTIFQREKRIQSCRVLAARLKNAAVEAGLEL